MLPKNAAGVCYVCFAILMVCSLVLSGAGVAAEAEPAEQIEPGLIVDPPMEPIPPEGTPAEDTPAGTRAESGSGEYLDLLQSDADLYPDLAEGEVCGESCDDIVYFEQPNCGPPGEYWFRGDYLLMWTKGSYLPPLVTTGPLPSTVLFGDRKINQSGRSSFRATIGWWIDSCHDIAMEGDYLDSSRKLTSYKSISAGDPVLARPYYDTFNDLQGAQAIAVPGLAVGCVDIRASDFYESAGARMRYNLAWLEACGEVACGGMGCGEMGCGEMGCGEMGCGETVRGFGGFDKRTFRLDFIAGYRYHRLNDNVSIREDIVSTGVGGPVIPGTMFNVRDTFRAGNEFNGGEIGLITEYTRGRWSIELLAKMALGVNHQYVRIDGNTTITTPTDPLVTATHQGGLYALRTNMGWHSKNEFTVIPQLGAELGYQVTGGLRLYAGYHILYWADVLRSADQINQSIDPRNIPPVLAGAGPDPTFAFESSNFWAQGLTAGFEIRY
ncbi:MAG: BBP7 family outer membrane beta-barrel protein [Candidatus Nealsonbacteria bacterium]|nr:BBP7 family outer membrane beta-barrel protein [Candidatus Nealsonbacteria bacterium]